MADEGLSVEVTRSPLARPNVMSNRNSSDRGDELAEKGMTSAVGGVVT
jgi:hypothetical protein